MAKEKFFKNYFLRVETSVKDEFIIVEPPITLDVNVVRHTLSSVNNATFRIYNLSKATRDSIQVDSFEYQKKIGRRIELLAGYGSNLYTIFTGSIQMAQSERQGVDYVTTIQAYDGGYAVKQATIQTTLKAGTPYQKVVETLIGAMGDYGVSKGVLGQIVGATTRSVVLEGYAYELLKEYTNGDVFIDNQKVNVLKNREFLSRSVPEISSESGLIGTPVFEETILKFKMIFEPRLSIGQKFKIRSVTSSSSNISQLKEYKVTSITHSGTFSSGVRSGVTTEIGCAFAIEGFQGIL